MPNIMDDLEESIVKREMVLFFVIDQSGSMVGQKMGAVNTAVREVIPELKTVGGADVDLKIAVLTFSDGCQWMYNTPISVEHFTWNKVWAGGVTDLGAACKELDEKMSKSGFLKSPSGSVAPAIFLMSDGQPSDEYKYGIAKLHDNNWFKHAIKIAVAIGEDADPDVLAEFTGNREAVITVHTPEALRKMIRFVSITSSQIGSKTQPVASGNIKTKQDDMIQQVQNYVESDPVLDPNNISTDGDAW